MSNEKNKQETEEIQDVKSFIQEKIEEGEFSLSAITLAYAKEQTRELSSEVKRLNNLTRELRSDYESQCDETVTAEAETKELRDQLNELEDISAKTLEDDLKLQIVKRLFKNMNLTQLEAIEKGAKEGMLLSGVTYQDY